MKIFIAGATGAVGKRLVPLLGASGTRWSGRRARPARRVTFARSARSRSCSTSSMRRPSAEPSRRRAGRRRAPGNGAVRTSGTCATSTRTFAETNRLRTEGTDNLLAAARRPARESSSPRASPAGRTRKRAPPSRTRRRRSIRPRWRAPRRAWRRFVTSRPRSSARRHSRGSCSGTAVSTGRGRRLPRVASMSRRSASASSRSSAAARECGRSSTSTTPRARRSPRSSAAGRGLYNIVDDEPAPTSEWLPYLAERARCEAAPSCAGVARPARRRRAGRLDERPKRVGRRTQRRSASSGGSSSTRPGARASSAL